MAQTIDHIKRIAPNFSGARDIQALGDLSILQDAPLLTLQTARLFVGFPVDILDGASPRPNNPRSTHPQGLALDATPTAGMLAMADHATRFLCLYYALKCMDLPGLGVYPRGYRKPWPFIHIDHRTNGPARWTGIPDECGAMQYTSGIDEAYLLDVVADKIRNGGGG